MAFPLINPFQQFFDSSGAPLVNGTIEFRDPTTNNLINSYPDADNADAQTNANDNPLTLDANGAAASGLYLEDGVDYKVILKTSAGATVTTQDDVLCPIVATQASIGALLYPTIADETSASATPVNFNYPPFHVLRYGTNTTPGTTNMTTALQSAINAASYGTAHKTVNLGNERLALDDIYCHYDAANNANFNSDANSYGHIVLQGTGAGDFQAFTIGSLYKGSVLHFNTDKGLKIGDGTNNSRGVWLKDLSAIGNTTGDIIKFDKVSRNCGIENAFVWNEGTGNGVIVSDCFLIDLTDVYIYLNNTAGIGWQCINPVQSAGIFTGTRVTTRGGDYGTVFGNHTASTGVSLGNIILNGCQQTGCNSEGLVFGYQCLGATVISNYNEGNGDVGIRVFRESRSMTFIDPFFFNSTATEGDFVFGESGATAAVKKHVNITVLRARHVSVNAAAYVRYSAADARHVKIIEPYLAFKSAGVGDGFTLADEAQHGLVIERVIYSNAPANEITFPARVDLLIDEDSLGRYTWEAPHTFNDSADVVGYLHIPTALTTELENKTAPINLTATSGKRAGTMVRNSNTGLILTAVGSTDVSVWQDAQGVTIHTPV